MPALESRPLNWAAVLEQIETALVEAEASVTAHEKQLKKLDSLAVPAWNAWRERLEQWTDQLATMQALADKAATCTRETDQLLHTNEAALRGWLEAAARNRRTLAELP